jgi:hypothetical protein
MKTASICSASSSLEFELEQTTTSEVELTPEVPILEVIPPRKLLEIGKSYSFSVRLRAAAFVSELEEAQALLALAADPERCLELSGPTQCP